MAQSARAGPGGAVARGLARPQAKVLVWLVCAAPLAWLVYAAYADALGANPAEALIRQLGEMALRMLCVTLAITPLRVMTGWQALARWRRLLGLWCFSYATLHWLAYAWLDMGLEWSSLVADLVKRPFITMGMAAWLLLLPLALTSFNRAIRALGARRWQALHRAVYAVALLAVLHFLWMRSGKRLYGEVWVYGGILAGLLAWRIGHAWRGRRLQASRAARAVSASPPAATRR